MPYRSEYRGPRVDENLSSSSSNTKCKPEPPIRFSGAERVVSEDKPNSSYIHGHSTDVAEQCSKNSNQHRTSTSLLESKSDMNISGHTFETEESLLIMMEGFDENFDGCDFDISSLSIPKAPSCVNNTSPSSRCRKENPTTDQVEHISKRHRH